MHNIGCADFNVALVPGRAHAVAEGKRAQIKFGIAQKPFVELFNHTITSKTIVAEWRLCVKKKATFGQILIT